MSVTISQITKEQLRELIEDIVEQKILELLGDPDEGLLIKEETIERLKKQKIETKVGNRGRPFDEVIKELALE